jgi:hypothetical protein
MNRTPMMVFLILMIAASSTLLRAADLETAVTHFYNDLQALEARSRPDPKSLDKFLPALTPSFREAVAAQAVIIKAWGKAPKDIASQFAPANDGTIFTRVYESGIFEKIATTEEIGDRAYVSVTVSGDGVVAPKADKWTDMVILHRIEGKWLIDDILFDANGKNPETARRAIIRYGALPPTKPDPTGIPSEPRPIPE